MGAVPLLTREGEVELARRMERGKLRMQKAISRSALVQQMIVEIAEQIKKGTEELDAFVDLGDVEDGSAADSKKRADIKQQFADVSVLHKKQAQLEEKIEAVAIPNKKLRRKWLGKLARCKVETSKAIRLVPWQLPRWKQFTKEIDRTADELLHLTAELSRIDEK